MSLSLLKNCDPKETTQAASEYTNKIQRKRFLDTSTLVKKERMKRLRMKQDTDLEKRMHQIGQTGKMKNLITIRDALIEQETD